MKIILINLARATERRQRMDEQFKSFNLDYDVLDATDGRHLSADDKALVDHESRKAITPHPLTDNEIGCWISHRRAMRAIIDSGVKMAAILEDDAALAADFPYVLEAIEDHGGSFDFIDLHRNFKRDEFFVSSRPLLPGCDLGRIGYTHMRATAYVMSREGAKKFLNYAPRFAHAVDKELHRWWANGLDIYGLEKPVAVQDDGGHSYIEETRGQERPQERLRYPDANQLQWRLKRKITRAMDSIQKRVAFPAYVRKGRVA
ncbi:MAG: glycosyltransferase family 25 protein [Alphaproteobacteria bacterium]